MSPRRKPPRSPMVGVLFASIAVAAIVVAHWSTAVAFGMVAGAVCAVVLGAIALRVVVRFDVRKFSYAQIGAGFGGLAVATIAIVGAIGGLAAALGATGALIAAYMEVSTYFWLTSRGELRKLAAIVRAVDRNEDPAPLLNALPPQLKYHAMRLLGERARWADLAAWLARIAPPAGKRDELFVTWQVAAHLALGEVASARAALDAGRAPNSAPWYRELAAQDRARVEIAEGAAKEVLERFGEEPFANSGPDLRWSRLLVRADAFYAVGDEASARALIDRVRAVAGEAVLADVKAANRPISNLV